MVKHTPTRTGDGRREPHGSDRRQFISRGSAAVLMPWLVGGVSLSNVHFQAYDVDPEIGYLRGSDRLVRHESYLRSLDGVSPGVVAELDALREQLGVSEPLEIVPAAYLASGHGAFAIRPPTVWIHGLLPPPAIWSGVPHSIAVEATYPVNPRPDGSQGGGTLRYDANLQPDLRSLYLGAEAPTGVIAWRYRSDPVETIPAPNAFRVPVRVDRPLRLAVEIVPRGGQSPADGSGDAVPAAERMAVSLTLGFTPGSAKLTPGTYFVGLDSSASGRLPFTADFEYLVPAEYPTLAFSIIDDHGTFS